MEYRADLHTHSFFSDGLDTPEQLLQKAIDANLSAISITDHDTISAYDETLLSFAKKNKITLIPGVEISSRQRQEDVHILAYNFNLSSSSFSTFLQQVRMQRENRNKKICEKLSSQGMVITQEELRKIGVDVIGRPHIAQLLVKKGYAKDFQDAFKKYLRKNACAYVITEKFSPLDVIQQVHLAKGKAIIAHPHFISSDKVLRDLCQMPFDGIEGNYSYFSAEENKRWIDIGKEKGWIVTGGSDYHGEIKPHVQLGNAFVGKDVIDRLQS